MILSESLGWLLEDYECSGIKVYCDNNKVLEIKDSFLNEFNELWEEALQSVEEEYGDCEEMDLPVSITITDYGFFMNIYQLEISYCYGDFYEVDYGPNAFNKAFSNMKEKYPDIQYEGLVFYPLCDRRCGELIQHVLSTKDSVDAYDFIGAGIASMLSSDEADELLAEQLENNLDFKDTIKCIYNHKDYIEEDIIDNVMDIILDIAEENDEDREELEEFIEAIQSRDYEEPENDDDFDNLPDGYMEALDMFMKAEELGAPMPKAREVISSVGTFDIVINKAEQGDAESKFIAGKYFIADHIEEEIDKAIRWIQESADEGIQEAKDYIKEYSDLFE